MFVEITLTDLKTNCYLTDTRTEWFDFQKVGDIYKWASPKYGNCTTLLFEKNTVVGYTFQKKIDKNITEKAVIKIPDWYLDKYFELQKIEPDLTFSIFDGLLEWFMATEENIDEVTIDHFYTVYPEWKGE